MSQLATFDFALAVGPQTPAASLKNWLPGKKPIHRGDCLVRRARARCRISSACCSGGRGRGAAPRSLQGIGGDPRRPRGRPRAHGGHDASAISSRCTRSKRIRILATSGAARSPFVPDVPTFREAGFDIEGTSWFGAFAPARTPRETVDRYSMNHGRRRSACGRARAVLGWGRQPTGTSAAEFAAIQKADSERWAPAVKASGFSGGLRARQRQCVASAGKGWFAVCCNGILFFGGRYDVLRSIVRGDGLRNATGRRVLTGLGANLSRPSRSHHHCFQRRRLHRDARPHRRAEAVGTRARTSSSKTVQVRCQHRRGGGRNPRPMHMLHLAAQSLAVNATLVPVKGFDRRSILAGDPDRDRAGRALCPADSLFRSVRELVEDAKSSGRALHRDHGPGTEHAGDHPVRHGGRHQDSDIPYTPRQRRNRSDDRSRVAAYPCARRYLGHIQSGKVRPPPCRVACARRTLRMC